MPETPRPQLKSSAQPPVASPEHRRLALNKLGEENWHKWGPYLTERQWGTVREDYSPKGDAWEHVDHDAARSKAYRWGEEGIAGISDEKQSLCFSLAMWNGQDVILKERMFGVTGNQGNHGEDVKEHYYYLDSTPTHSYMKMLYKYPQGAFPYEQLKEENGKRSKDDPEFELNDSGIFDEDRYFDVQVEYAKVTTDDILVRITAVNRGPDAAAITLVPQLWFRNTWSWDPDVIKPQMSATPQGVKATSTPLGTRYLFARDADEVLFTDNETNGEKLYQEPENGGFYKDGINDYIVEGKGTAVNPDRRGTKAACVVKLQIAPGASRETWLRLSEADLPEPFERFSDLLDERRQEADEFYAVIQAGNDNEDARHVQRQAFAGMMWSKQFYNYDVRLWLQGDKGHTPPPESRRRGRNHEWEHLSNADVISMPDTWEYPWYAAWDLAFHCLPIALIDAEFAKRQLLLLTREWYMHPNGQLPAYEWAFGDVNPPVHAWAAWRVYKIDKKHTGVGDTDFLERVFQKLLLNFTWWINRKDPDGNNIFQGGFLGLDNIGVFDRSSPSPTGGRLEQSDGTSWMAMYCLNMLKIALELAETNDVYEDMATKFFEHFLYIAKAMMNIGGDGVNLWDEEDGFYYDVLHTGDHSHVQLKVRSMVGLIPLFAVETLEPEQLEKVPRFKERLEWFLEARPDLAQLVSRWFTPGAGERRLLSLVRGHRMKKLLKRMLDESEFLSDHGVRALSKYHETSPYEFHVGDEVFKVKYQPAESDSELFGGNSNWRGPIWFPVNFLLIESLQKFHHYYGDDFRVECPTGSGNYVTIENVAEEIGRRLTRLFLKDADGHRPIYRHDEKMMRDAHFKDHVLFYEYFHGDNGRGVGASHQTGWTGLVAKLLHRRESDDPTKTGDEPKSR